MTEKLMFDSNMFDEVVDGKISPSLLQDYDAVFYVTPIQRQELEDAGDDRAEELRTSFESIADEVVNAIATFNTRGAGFGNASFATSEQSEVLTTIREAHAPEEIEDTNMAAVAISDGITFITSDERLQNALERTYPDSYLSREDFLVKLKN